MRGIFLLMLLTACAGEPVYQPVDISVPVATPCKPPAIKPPDWPLQTTSTQAPLFDKVKTALAELELRKAYETELEAAVKACE